MVVAVICGICTSFQYVTLIFFFLSFIFFFFQMHKRCWIFVCLLCWENKVFITGSGKKTSCYCFTSAEENQGFISYIKPGESDCIWHLSCVTNGFVKYYLQSIMVICLLGGCNKRITFLFNGYNSSSQYTEYFIPQQGINRMSALKLHLFPKSSTTNSFLCVPISSSQAVCGIAFLGEKMILKKELWCMTVPCSFEQV